MHPQALGDLSLVVGFNNFLFGVIQGAVAVQNAQAAGSQVSLIVRRNAADHGSNADPIAGAMPGLTLDSRRPPSPRDLCR